MQDFLFHLYWRSCFFFQCYSYSSTFTDRQIISGSFSLIIMSSEEEKAWWATARSTDIFFVFPQCLFLCTLPRVPLFYFLSCTLFAPCRPLSFIKRNQCLCLTLRTFGTQSARCRRSGGLHCPSLLTLARQRAEWSTNSARQASIKYLLECNITVHCFS